MLKRITEDLLLSIRDTSFSEEKNVLLLLNEKLEIILTSYNEKGEYFFNEVLQLLELPKKQNPILLSKEKRTYVVSDYNGISNRIIAISYPISKDYGSILGYISMFYQGETFNKNNMSIVTELLSKLISENYKELTMLKKIDMLNFKDDDIIDFDLITKKEFEIIDLIFAGYTDKQIASNLHISFSTVRSHINSIFNKINVDNRVLLIRKYLNYLLKQH